MQGLKKVVIGIQARSTSERFPRKVFEPIDGIPMLAHVIRAADRCASYMNRNTARSGIEVKYAVVTPYGDEIVNAFKSQNTLIFEGPENDVLSRYQMMSEAMQADYIVRITGDCPLIPPFLISKHIKTAVVEGYDYLSNVDEKLRTAADGMDCEVISRKLIEYAFQHAKETYDREHVTTFLRRSPPDWAKIGHVVGFLQQAGLKLSVDTVEDLERVKEEYWKIKDILNAAQRMRGSRGVHRI